MATKVYTCGMDGVNSKNLWEISVSALGVPTVVNGWNIDGLASLKSITSGPGGITVYVGSQSDWKVRKVDGSGVLDGTWATGGVYTAPGQVWGVTVDPDGNLYVGINSLAVSLRKLTAAGAEDWLQSWGQTGFRTVILSDGTLLTGFATSVFYKMGARLNASTGAIITEYGSPVYGSANFGWTIIADPALENVYWSAGSGTSWTGLALAICKQPIDGTSVTYTAGWGTGRKQLDYMFHSSGRLFSCGAKQDGVDEGIFEINPATGGQLNRYRTGSHVARMQEDEYGHIITCGIIDSDQDGVVSNFRVFDVELNLLGYLATGDPAFPNSSLFDCVVPLSPPPVITDQTVSPVALFTTNPMSLFITVDGIGTITYQWAKDGEDLLGETASTLSVASAVDSTAGSYVCTATDVIGSVVSTPIVVTIYSASGAALSMFDLFLDQDKEVR